jgi:hypothetical protein
MISKTFAASLLAAGCVTAAAAGAYVGVRHNASAPQAPATATPANIETPQAGDPVSETEAVVKETAAPAEVPVEEQDVEPSRPTVTPAKPAPSTTRAPAARNARAGTRTTPAAAPVRPAVVPDPSVAAPAQPAPEPIAPVATVAEPVHPADPPPAPPEARFEELVLPAASVIGLQVETPLSSERSRVEDRVDARVTRDVTAAGRVAIPAGSRVVGAVTLVERGGKLKERARLGVRFHTLVLADGTQIPLRTEPILREGDAPSGESARKIGGSAIGGAILGAIIGGGKGAVIGGATGAGAGTAAVMAGDRNSATLPAGTIVTVRLASPASIEVERR